MAKATMLLILWMMPGFLSQTIQVSQVPVIYGTKGGSITLPCNYSLGGREKVTDGTYRWYKNGAKIGPEVSNNIPDYTGRISRADVNQFIEGRSAAITLHIVGPVDTGLYYCEVSFHTGGQVTGYGNGTFLNVTAGFLSQTIQVSQVPVIYGTKGGSVTLPCNYSLGGRENVTAGTYRWYKNVAKIGPEVSNNNPDYTGRISRADVNQFIEGRSATITQHIVGPVDTGLYYCEVSFQTGGQVSGYGNGTFLNVTAGTEEMGHTNNQTYFYVKVAGGILFVVFLGVLYGQVDKQVTSCDKRIDSAVTKERTLGALQRRDDVIAAMLMPLQRLVKTCELRIHSHNPLLLKSFLLCFIYFLAVRKYIITIHIREYQVVKKTLSRERLKQGWTKGRHLKTSSYIPSSSMNK